MSTETIIPNHNHDLYVVDLHMWRGQFEAPQTEESMLNEGILEPIIAFGVSRVDSPNRWQTHSAPFPITVFGGPDDYVIWDARLKRYTNPFDESGVGIDKFINYLLECLSSIDTVESGVNQ